MNQVEPSPELEVLRRPPRRGSRRAPLLFVHGAYAAAWCWDEHFLPYFAGRGYDCYAVSLRGHGASGSGMRLADAGLSDYVEDVAEVAARLPAPPVLIGHSMGGAVAQRCASAAAPRGLALLASVPPQGLWGTAVDLWWRDPALLAQLSLVQAGHAGRASFASLRDALFSPELGHEKAWSYLARMQPESHRALLDLSWMHLAPPRHDGSMPVLVMGGEDDTLFPPPVVEGTARWYGTDAVILPGMAHLMMLDAAWRSAADGLLEWLAGVA